ncbi:MAG: hypothetical protein PUB37_04325 [Firmicutes bacterium]|nr:hypothetical protein [Bacillota bacterium]
MQKKSVNEIDFSKVRELLFKSKRRTAIVIAGFVALIAAIVIIAVLCCNADVKSRQYSGEETNDSLIMCMDVKRMEKYEVLEVHDDKTGPYSENVLAEGCVDIHIWRDFTRPKMSCKKQILEKYPRLSGFKKQKAGDNPIIAERAVFYTKSDGEKLFHTVVLLREDGWDYLVDVAVKKDIADDYEEYIDNLIDGLFYL